MTNALVKFTAKQELSEVEQFLLEEAHDDIAAFDMQPLIVTLAPGGIGQFVFGDDTKRSFSAVAAISQKTRGYWPSSKLGEPPACSSPNGSHGFFNIELTDDQFKAASKPKLPHPGIIALTENKPMPPQFDCLNCPMNQWGSEHKREGGRGKACKEMRRLLLLVDDYATPVVFSLPPTSIKAWDSYCSNLAAKRSAYFAVKTKFELDTAESNGGEKYNIVKTTMEEALTDIETIKALGEIRKQYRELVSQMPVMSEEYNTTPANGDAETPVSDDSDIDAETPF